MKRILFLSIALAVGSITAWGQRGTEVRGRITDERDATVAGAEVRLRARTGRELSVTSGDDGTYVFANVAPGDYILEVRAKGFASFASRLTLAPGQSAKQDVQLSIDAISETVSVIGTGTAQTVDETSKAINVLEQSLIEARREISLSESLRGTAGVRIQQQGSAGALTSVRLRGQRPFDTAV